MSEVKRCGKTATQLVAWGGKLVPCCDVHAADLKEVGDCIGCPTDSTPNTSPTLTCIQVLPKWTGG